MSWLNYVEDQAKKAAKKAGNAAGDVVDAVVPDAVQNAVSSVVQSPIVNNPVTRSVASGVAQAGIPGPTAVPVNLLNLGRSAANGSLNPIEILGAITGLGAPGMSNTASWALDRAKDAATSDAIRSGAGAVGSAAGSVAGTQPVQTAMRAIGKAAELADKPRQAVISDMGDQAYYQATHNGDKPNHGLSADPYVLLGNALPDSFLTKWANDPKNWPAIKKAYEDGYNGFTGGRAVWELYAGQIGGVTKTLADIAFDPLNAIPGVGAFGRGLEKTGRAAALADDATIASKVVGKSGNLIAHSAEAVDRAQALPFELAGKGLRRIPGVEEAASAVKDSRAVAGARNLFGLNETEASKVQRATDSARDTMGGVNLNELQDVPDWATPRPGTGKYEAIEADRNVGATYIVDRDGNPVPGTAKVGKGEQKRNRSLAERYNRPGAAAPVGRSMPEGPRPGDLIPAPEPQVELDGWPSGPQATVGPNPATMPEAYFAQDAARREAIQNRTTSWMAPNVGDRYGILPNQDPDLARSVRIPSRVAMRQGENPEAARAFYTQIGLDPDTFAPQPGGWADRYDLRSASLDDAQFPTFFEKVARQKMTGIEQAVDVHMPAYLNAFNDPVTAAMRPSASRPIESLVADLNAFDDRSQRALADLMDRAVYSESNAEAQAAMRSLKTWAKENDLPFLRGGGEVTQDLTKARSRYVAQLRREAKPTEAAQTVLDAGKNPRLIALPETTEAMLKRNYDAAALDYDQLAFLSKPFGDMNRPVADELFDRMRSGMSQDEAIQSVVKDMHKTPEGKAANVAPQEVKKNRTALKKVATLTKMSRENMQFNVANAVPGTLGDRLGNTMMLIQEGKYVEALKSLDPRILWQALANPADGVQQYFSTKNNELFAGFGREMSQASMPTNTRLGLETRFGDEGNGLILPTALKNRSRFTRTLAKPFASQWVADTRGAMELVNRGVLNESEIAKRLPMEIVEFGEELKAAGLPAMDTIRAIQQRATDLRAPADFLRGAKGKTRRLQSFNQQDVFAITGDRDLARSWARRENRMFREADDEARRVFFAGAKRYGIDDKFGQVMFFHYWASRALAQQARAVARSPRVLSMYYRMIQGAMHEADRNNYSPTFRGLMHYYGDTSNGFYALWNPLGVMVPAMIFADLSNLQDDPNASTPERWFNRASSLMPLAPWVTAAGAALGLTDDTPNFTGTARIENIVTDVLNFANARGIDVTKNGVVTNPIQHFTQYALEQVNKVARQATGQRYTPYDATAGKMDTLNSVLISNLIDELGPQESWSADDWKRLQDGLTAIQFGGTGNEDAMEAMRDYSAAALINRAASSVLPQGSVLRFGPREQMRAGAKAPGFTVDDANRDLATGTPEMQQIISGQQALNTLGTDQQRMLYDGWSKIVYDVADIDPSSPEAAQTIQIGATTYTVRDLIGMSEDQRRRIADSWVSGWGGTDDLKAYRAERDTFIQGNPSLATFTEYKKQVGTFKGGAPAFLSWAQTVSPQFKAEYDDKRRYLMETRHLGGAALDAELEKWAFTTDAYAAFSGIRASVYDAAPLGGASSANDPMQAFPGSESGGGGRSSGRSQSLSDRLYRAIDRYNEDLDAFRAENGGRDYALPGAWGYGAPTPPEMGAELQRYVSWAQRQPDGADTSPEAYEAAIAA